MLATASVGEQPALQARGPSGNGVDGAASIRPIDMRTGTHTSVAEIVALSTDPSDQTRIESRGEVEPIDVGIAGRSAREIADRQQAKRDRERLKHDDATRGAHPRSGGLLIRTRDILAGPEKPTSWQKGAAGEEAVGKTLDRLTDEGFVVLHDRRKPGTKWNLDHVVVGPRGVYAIDAKHYSGVLEIRRTGSLFRPGPKRVFVKGRSQDKRVVGMDWQIEWLRDAAGELLDVWGGVTKPVLCFIGVQLAPAQQPELVGANNVLVTWPRRFIKDVGRDGSLNPEQIAAIAARIAQALPPAMATIGRNR